MATTCIGVALGIVYMTCTQPVVAPTGKAPFCETMQRAVQGGKLRPSRQDTRGTKEDVDAINSAYDRLCAGKAKP